jgi:PAT family beta-lactamase induction signal transducer AmpG
MVFKHAIAISAFLIVGLTIPLSNFFVISLAVFFAAAFASASNDVASDGFYLLVLERPTIFFFGIRSTFYRLSMLTETD